MSAFVAEIYEGTFRALGVLTHSGLAHLLWGAVVLMEIRASRHHRVASAGANWVRLTAAICALEWILLALEPLRTRVAFLDYAAPLGVLAALVTLPVLAIGLWLKRRATLATRGPRMSALLAALLCVSLLPGVVMLSMYLGGWQD